MEGLIEALTIFAKYIEDGRPRTTCEHDELYVCVNPSDVSEEDRARLAELTFDADPDLGSFLSTWFGSC